jgi:hypothetical protein
MELEQNNMGSEFRLDGGKMTDGIISIATTYDWMGESSAFKHSRI